MKNKIVQDPPFTMQIEPTEGCNLGCSFCGLHGMREKGTKPWNFMTVETAERIASEVARVGWKCKFVFAMHGEPTLNPAFIDIVATFRKHLPKAVFHMYSNGYGMNHAKDTSEYLDRLFEAGMNDILVDCYTAKGDWNFVEKIDIEKYNVVTLEPGVPYYYPKQGRRICLLPPIAEDDTNKMTRRLANHCGAAFPLDDSFNNKRCTFPRTGCALERPGVLVLRRLSRRVPYRQHPRHAYRRPLEPSALSCCPRDAVQQRSSVPSVSGVYTCQRPCRFPA